MTHRSERVLITGGTGFTGGALAKRLRQDGHEVVAVGRERGAEETINLDIRDLPAVTEALSRMRPSVIVHLAGIAATTHGDVGEIYSANTVGTANLFAALTAAKIEPKVVIVASSGQVYAVRNDLPLEEDCPLEPKTHYAVSKRAAEDIAKIYSEQFPVIVTRPFNYTGPGQSAKFIVAKIVQHYVEVRKEIRLGNLDLFRDFSDVRRVVEAYARLVSSAIEPTTVNICSGRTVHLAEILEIMEDISGHTLKVVPEPSLFRHEESRVILGSSARLETLVGPLPNPDFRETLLRMYQAGCEPNQGR